MYRVPNSIIRREQIERLLETAERFEDHWATWQLDDGPPAPTDVRQAQREYQDWYSESLTLIAEEARVQFRDMYEGGSFTPRIKAFLSSPLERNPFHDPSEPNPLIGPWQHPFDRTFRDNIVVQRGLLVQALHAVADGAEALQQLVAIFRRLPEFLAVLRHAKSDNVPEPVLTNERDLQVLVHGLLRLLFDDVRDEDPVPQQAGASSRVDFLLRDVGVVVETKMMRPSLSDRTLGEELLVDWGRYPRHPDCRAILALVYDPDRRIKNAAALERDLSQEHSNPVTRVLIIR
jgi:hypothetical protein